MAEGLIRAGLDKLESKFTPTISASIFVPTEQYRTIFPLLDVWGYSDNDKDVSDKTKYIYDKLIELNKEKPQEALTTLLTDLGATKWNENKLDRVYKYFHLRAEAEKALKYHDLLHKEIEGLKGK